MVSRGNADEAVKRLANGHARKRQSDGMGGRA
jgi:hypothetical protein